MTQNGRAYRQRLWVPAISVTGGGALPTPVSGEKQGATSGGKDPGLNGGSAARQMLADAGFPRAAGAPSSLPMPKAGDGERGRDKARARPDLKGRELATVLRDQLPTPRAADGMLYQLRTPEAIQSYLDRSGREHPQKLEDFIAMLPTLRTCSAMAAAVNTKGNLEGERFPNLETVIGRQLLTPCASDWKGRTNWEAAERHGPQRLPDCLPTGAATYLNPSFVEEMMGFPVGWTVLKP